MSSASPSASLHEPAEHGCSFLPDQLGILVLIQLMKPDNDGCQPGASRAWPGRNGRRQDDLGCRHPDAFNGIGEQEGSPG